MIEPRFPFDPDWPSVWQFGYFSEGQNTVTKTGTMLTVLKDSSLQYKCLCGAEHNRHVEQKIEETREWVKEHKEHLTKENT